MKKFWDRYHVVILFIVAIAVTVFFSFVSAFSIKHESYDVEAQRWFDRCPKVRLGDNLADAMSMQECFKYCAAAGPEEARQRCNKLVIKFFFPEKENKDAAD